MDDTVTTVPPETADPSSDEVSHPAPATGGGASSGGRSLGLGKVAVLVAACAFLVGAIGFVVGERLGIDDPLSDVDVGFMRDMGAHHAQAVEMSIILLSKDGIDPTLDSFAMEIIITQRYDQGVFSALLDRYGEVTEPGDTVMGWMGPAIPFEEMDGLASEAEMEALADAEGDAAEALWISLMSEHHLGGMHMADHAARYGSDRTVVNFATSMVRNQRDEILDLARYRRRTGVAIPDGYADPLEDQRLNPISLAND